MILIVAPENDIHALAVARSIIEETSTDKVRIFDSATLPLSATISIGTDGWSLRDRRGQALDSDDITAVWWRRSKKPHVSREIVDPIARGFAERECDHALKAIAMWSGYLVINPSDKVLIANNKPIQLMKASAVGLEVPETLITNNKEQAEEFLRSHLSTIFKVMSPPLGSFAETRRVRTAYQSDFHLIADAPVIFQREVVKKRELRVTVIGELLFTAEVCTNNVKSSKYPDWRLDPTHECRLAEIPGDIATKLTIFMRELGLYYGAIDLIEDCDGHYVFLEVNTSGQFLFVEIDTGLPISRAIARLLLHERGCAAGSN